MSGFQFGTSNENKAAGSFNFGTGASVGSNPATTNTLSTSSSFFKSPAVNTNTGTTGTDGNTSGFSFGNALNKSNGSRGMGFNFTGAGVKETNPSTSNTNGADNKGFAGGFQPLYSKPTNLSFGSTADTSKNAASNVFGSSSSALSDAKASTAPGASAFSFGNATASSDPNLKDENAAGSFSSFSQAARTGSDISFKSANTGDNSKAESSVDASKTTTSGSAFSFGNTTASFKPTSTDDTSKVGGFSFTSQPLNFSTTSSEQKQDTTTATTTQASTPSAAFSFTSNTPSTTTSSGSTFSFTTPSSDALSNKTTSSNTPTSTSTFSFNSGASEGKSSSAFSFGGSVPTSSVTSVSGSKTESTLTQSNETSKPIPAKFIGRTVEEIINMWSEQLERNAETFTKEAVKVCNWDMELMESQKLLGDIANDVRRIQVGQKELDVNLDTIFAYQNELNSTLSELEQSVEKMYESQDQMPIAADIEREQTLQLAVDVDDQLNTLTDTLKETVESMNQAQRETMDDDNPITQIIKVLNVHHNSLRWIEDNSSRMNQEINQLTKKLSTSTLQ
uniref:Nuclear pore glycoprotein putative n=1 Tax=Albugo laibachii Nc14 TaxID=890382 RepID=F0WL73_9STRA|nr:nuclear pore glycoprotein putative [Albugo laibachii Nc14]|eukprot:CCA22034.1 nuclear pore glycoprotein putative [Albugo laibachii Nc14]